MQPGAQVVIDPMSGQPVMIDPVTGQQFMMDPHMAAAMAAQPAPGVPGVGALGVSVPAQPPQQEKGIDQSKILMGVGAGFFSLVLIIIVICTMNKQEKSVVTPFCQNTEGGVRAHDLFRIKGNWCEDVRPEERYRAENSCKEQSTKFSRLKAFCQRPGKGMPKQSCCCEDSKEKLGHQIYKTKAWSTNWNPIGCGKSITEGRKKIAAKEQKQEKAEDPESETQNAGASESSSSSEIQLASSAATTSAAEDGNRSKHIASRKGKPQSALTPDDA